MRIVLVLVSIACALLPLACGPSPEVPAAPAPASPALADYNVLLILVDTLRPDHLGAYGYTRKTSPFIDELASEGILFEDAWSTSSYTREAVATLFTGLYPSANPYGSGWYARPNPKAPTLATIFKDAGYRTGMFTNSPMVDNAAFYKGYEEFECLVKDYGISGQEPRLAARAQEFIAKHQQEKWFLYLHFLDPHAPYDPPESYYRRFSESVFPTPLNLVQQVRPALAELVADGFGPGDPRFDDLVLRYDAEIAFLDDTLRSLHSALEQLELDERTLIILTADHGEEFLEHGFVEHGWYLYRESIHIPLIFWAPGHLGASRVKGAVSIADIMPTLLDLKDLPPPDYPLNGRSLLAADAPPLALQSHGQPIIAEMLLPMRNIVRSVIAQGHTYITAQQWLTPEQAQAISKQQERLRDEFGSGRRPVPPLWADPVHEAIYDLEADPGQKNDLLGQAPPDLETLREILAEFRKTTPYPVADKDKLAEDEQLSPEQREQLESIGYIGDTPAPDSENAEPIVPAPVPEVPSETEEQLRNLGYL